MLSNQPMVGQAGGQQSSQHGHHNIQVFTTSSDDLMLGHHSSSPLIPNDHEMSEILCHGGQNENLMRRSSNETMSRNNSDINNSITCAINAAIAEGIAQQQQLVHQLQQPATTAVSAQLQNEDHVCNDCQEIFKNKVSFNLHRRQKHGDRQQPLALSCLHRPAATGILQQALSNLGHQTATSSNAANNNTNSMMMMTPQHIISASASGGKTFTCEYCGELYRSRPSFTRHKNRAHPFASFVALPTLTPPTLTPSNRITSTSGGGGSNLASPSSISGSQISPSKQRRSQQLAGKMRTVRCGKCYATVSNQSNLCAHLRDKHNEATALIERRQFDSMVDFYAWKAEVERQSKSVYLKRRKKDHGDLRKHYFYCRRSGCFESKANGIRARLSNKVGYHCTGFMTACENLKSGDTNIEYCLFHYCQDELVPAVQQQQQPLSGAVPSSGGAGNGGSGGLLTTSQQTSNKHPRRHPKMEKMANTGTPQQTAVVANAAMPMSLCGGGAGGSEMHHQQPGAQLHQLAANLMQQHQQNDAITMMNVGHHQINNQQQAGQPFLQTATLNFQWPNVSGVKVKDGNVKVTGSMDKSMTPATTNSQPSMLSGRLVSVPGPGGATTAYISSLDVGALYGYELVEQGKVVCSADSSLNYANNGNEPLPIFVTTNAAGGGNNQLQQMNGQQQQQQNPAGETLRQQQQHHISQLQMQQMNQQQQMQHTDKTTAAAANNGSNQPSSQQQNHVLLKETCEYLDCSSANVKMCPAQLSEKKAELLKNIHTRSMELFNLTMWLNEDERSKRAGTYHTDDNINAYNVRQHQQPSYGNFEAYDHGKTNMQQQQQQQSNEVDEEKFIKITVVSPHVQNGQLDEVRFRIKSTTELGKLKRSYADRLGVFVSSLRFVYRNRVISDEETPHMLKMDAEDVVQVYPEQAG